MILKRLLGLFSNDLAVDLGTANTLVYVPDRGVILNEPSVVAIRTGSGMSLMMAYRAPVMERTKKMAPSIMTAVTAAW